MQTYDKLINGELLGSKSIKLCCGLNTFPPELFLLTETLEILDLSGNNLSELPTDFGRFKKLKIAFFSTNKFTVFPKVLADCPSLTMIGFKSNQLHKIEENSFPPSLQWLILTDNKLTKLPATIGNCHLLQKVALAGNLLTSLPLEMKNCTNLELLRISANRLEQFPQWLLELPRLSWLAFSGNPCCPENPFIEKVEEIHWNELDIREQLGEGASGIISKAIWDIEDQQEVAVKLFKGEITSDGFPEDEMNNYIAAGDHGNLVPIIGKISNHPEGKIGLVMELIPADYSNLAYPPNFETCTRDVFSQDRCFSIHEIMNIALSIASASVQLHERGILHGDIYAHNTLVDSIGNAYLGDFGAASTYQKNHSYAHFFERIDLRAFGCLLDDLLQHLDTDDTDIEFEFSLQNLANDCMNSQIESRMNFQELYLRLNELKKNLWVKHC